MSRKLRNFGDADASPDLSTVLSWLEALIEQEDAKPKNWQGPLAKRLAKAEEAASLLQEVVDSQ